MSGSVLLAHGDDAYEIDRVVKAFAARVGAADLVVLAPDRSPDESVLERAQLESASLGLFGAHCVVVRQPLRAAGTSSAAADRLLSLVEGIADGAALALAELRPSRDVGRPPALLTRLEAAVRAVDGEVVPCPAPRRDELRGWLVRHADELGIPIRPPAAAALAQRIGGVWENDVERSRATISPGAWSCVKRPPLRSAMRARTGFTPRRTTSRPSAKVWMRTPASPARRLA